MTAVRLINQVAHIAFPLQGPLALTRQALMTLIGVSTKHLEGEFFISEKNNDFTILIRFI